MITLIIIVKNAKKIKAIVLTNNKKKLMIKINKNLFSHRLFKYF